MQGGKGAQSNSPAPSSNPYAAQSNNPYAAQSHNPYAAQPNNPYVAQSTTAPVASPNPYVSAAAPVSYAAPSPPASPSPTVAAGASSPAASQSPSIANRWDVDIKRSPEKQQLLAHLLTQLPAWERSILGTHVAEVIWIPIVCFIQGIIWVFFQPFEGNTTSSKLYVAIALIATWVFTLRINFFVYKYYTLTMKLFHGITLKNLCSHVDSLTLNQLDAKYKKTHPDKKWMGFLPYRFALYSQFCSLILAVIQMCRTVLIPYGSNDAVTKAAGITIADSSTFGISSQDEYAAFFWICVIVIGFIILLAWGALLIPLILCEPWCVRYFKLFAQVLRVAKYETRNRALNCVWVYNIFIFIFDWIVRSRDKPQTAQRAWTVSYITMIAKVIEILFIPASMILVRVLSCKPDGELVDMPSIRCWESDHKFYALGGMFFILPWYFLCVFTMSWANTFFAFDDRVMTADGCKPALKADAIILFSSNFQYHLFSIRMMVAALALILGPLYPGVISVVLVILCAAMLLDHGFVPLHPKAFPSNVYTVNYWHGTAIFYGSLFSLFTTVCLLTGMTSTVLYVVVFSLLFVWVVGAAILWRMKISKEVKQSMLSARHQEQSPLLRNA